MSQDNILVKVNIAFSAIIKGYTIFIQTPNMICWYKETHRHNFESNSFNICYLFVCKGMSFNFMQDSYSTLCFIIKLILSHDMASCFTTCQIIYMRDCRLQNANHPLSKEMQIGSWECYYPRMCIFLFEKKKKLTKNLYWHFFKWDA